MQQRLVAKKEISSLWLFPFCRNVSRSYAKHSFRRLKINNCVKSHSSSSNGLSVYVEKQPIAWKECCMKYRCEKAKTHMSRWTGRRDMTDKLLKTALNPNKSIQKLSLCMRIKMLLHIKHTNHLCRLLFESCCFFSTSFITKLYNLNRPLQFRYI